MICSICGHDSVVWGPLFMSTRCTNCGGVNCQEHPLEPDSELPHSDDDGEKP